LDNEPKGRPSKKVWKGSGKQKSKPEMSQRILKKRSRQKRVLHFEGQRQEGAEEGAGSSGGALQKINHLT